MSLKFLDVRRFVDSRGWFAEVYSERALNQLGLSTKFVQDNQSYSAESGTVRGLHFQRPPYAQAKLVRCTHGSILDVAVDLRAGSPTFGKWAGAVLSARNGRQMFIPEGFAHGFVTLEPDTEVTYKVSDFYNPSAEGGVIWDDPDVAIEWPKAFVRPHISPKDQLLPRLAQFDSPFPYDGVPLSKTGLQFVE